jgi:threonine/homoserine/homoserine lactone efflux protein
MADAVYGAIAAFSLTIISSFLVEQQIWLRLLGGLFLLYLGIRTYFAKSETGEVDARSETKLGAYASTFFLTLTNPLTILSFAAIYSGLGLVGNGGGMEATLMVLGVFCGSALWWFFLSFGVGLFSSHVTISKLTWINRISGVIIAGFGLLSLFTLIQS